MSYPLQNPLQQADSQKQKNDCTNIFSPSIAYVGQLFIKSWWFELGVDIVFATVHKV